MEQKDKTNENRHSHHMISDTSEHAEHMNHAEHAQHTAHENHTEHAQPAEGHEPHGHVDHHAMMVADFRRRFIISLILMVPLAAGILYNQGVMITPAFGAVLMSMSTIIVAINARLIRS